MGNRCIGDEGDSDAESSYFQGHEQDRGVQVKRGPELVPFGSLTLDKNLKEHKADAPQPAYAKRIGKRPKLYQAVEQNRRRQLSSRPLVSSQQGGVALPLYFIHDIKAVYQGQWLKGKPNGLGKLYFYNGDYYEGSWLKGQPEGEDGIFFYPNGAFKRGNIVKGELEGYGIYVDEKGTLVYQGQWKDSVPHGKGKQTFRDGSVYQGMFQKGLKHDPKGFYKFANGKVYQGGFENGYMEGQGKLYIPGRKGEYIGQFSKNLIVGKGVMKTETGQYKGNFQDGEFQGRGMFKWYDGKIYVGQFDKGEIHGKGKMQFPNGQIAKGIWRYGENTKMKKLSTKSALGKSISLSDKESETSQMQQSMQKRGSNIERQSKWYDASKEFEYKKLLKGYHQSQNILKQVQASSAIINPKKPTGTSLFSFLSPFSSKTPVQVKPAMPQTKNTPVSSTPAQKPPAQKSSAQTIFPFSFLKNNNTDLNPNSNPNPSVIKNEPLAPSPSPSPSPSPQPLPTPISILASQAPPHKQQHSVVANPEHDGWKQLSTKRAVIAQPTSTSLTPVPVRQQIKHVHKQQNIIQHQQSQINHVNTVSASQKPRQQVLVIQQRVSTPALSSLPVEHIKQKPKQPQFILSQQSHLGWKQLSKSNSNRFLLAQTQPSPQFINNSNKQAQSSQYQSQIQQQQQYITPDKQGEPILLTHPQAATMTQQQQPVVVTQQQQPVVVIASQPQTQSQLQPQLITVVAATQPTTVTQQSSSLQSPISKVESRVIQDIPLHASQISPRLDASKFKNRGLS